MKRVLVLTGTPGVGKSSVANLLTTRLLGKLVSLGDLVKNEGLHSGFDKQRGTLIADMKKVSKRIRGIIGQFDGYIIVDGHFAMDIVPASEVFLAFVLRRDPDELQQVLKMRGFEVSKMAENVAAEILDVCLFDAIKAYGEKKVCEVDVSGRSVQEIADEILCVVNERKECRVGVVDWLMKLEFEGRLDEFLKAL